MSLKGVVGVVLALCGLYWLLAGLPTAVVGGVHIISRTEVTTCAEGFLSSLTRKQAETCSVLFTNSSGLVTRTPSGHATFVDHQVARGDMRRLYLAVLAASPESMANAVSFDEWWNGLPIEGS
ncbi:hypothetical protein N5D99_18900 [Aeromonas caviae]|uniref:hypothetical protein n=1 Tax=Aeromonas caviae TaxID=648 RepID=UPI0024486364|nr:hypothetical protein [Aeromonas caviae]MDH1846927.1 hypothetical protein [Aeromonas caviae]